MKLFAGLPNSDYQDILRAIGALLDEHGLRDIRLWEHEDGLIVQGRPRDDELGQYQSFLLTDEDLNLILEAAYRRRNQGASSAA